MTGQGDAMRDQRNSKMIFFSIIIYVITAIAGMGITSVSAERKSAYAFFFVNMTLAITAAILYHDILIIDFRKLGARRFSILTALTSMLFISANLLGTVLYSAFFSPSTSNHEIIQSHVNMFPIETFVAIAFLAPVVEETIFRYIIQNQIKRMFVQVKAKACASNVITAAIFALFHGGFTVESIPYFFGGLAISAAYDKTDNYALVICAHSINNLVATFL